jgi:hypothetical protein
MFLIGKKDQVLKSETFDGLVCPNCKTKNSTTVQIIGVFKHLLQIPFLNGGKKGKSVCSKCNFELGSNQMPPTIKLAFFELKEQVKTPIWFYSGLIGIKTLVLIKIFSKYF